MLRINLLPIKASRKHDSVRNELFAVIGIFVVGLAVLLLVHLRTSQKIADLEQRITVANQEISHLKQDVVRVEEFKTKAEIFERKKKIVTDLQRMRVGPARMLYDLAVILNDQPKVWLSKATEKGGKLVLEGQAMEEEDVSDFQMALARRSKFFLNLHLDVVRSVAVGDVQVLEWQITCSTNYAAG